MNEIKAMRVLKVHDDGKAYVETTVLVPSSARPNWAGYRFTVHTIHQRYLMLILSKKPRPEQLPYDDMMAVSRMHVHMPP